MDFKDAFSRCRFLSQDPDEELIQFTSVTIGGCSRENSHLMALRQRGSLCDAFDGYGFEDDWGFGAVHAVAGDFADLFYYVVAFDDFAEDGVFASEPAGVGYGDEELAAVGVGASIGHGEFALFLEAVFGA